MNGTLLESIWAIDPAAIARVNAARMNGATIEVGAELPALRVAQVGSVAVIPIMGIMVKRTSIFGVVFGNETSTEAIGAAVRASVADPNIRAIVLRIDSPGGTTDGLAELGDAIWQARQAGATKIVAQVNGYCASAAYYVASQADEIWAGRMDMVGSIGTRAEVIDVSKALEAAGVEVLSFDSGPFKSLAAEGVPVTDEHKAEIQRIVDVFYADFLKMVQRGRGMQASALKPLADGRMFFAGQAVQSGLIDGIRTIEETVRKLSGGQRNRNRQRQAMAI